MSEEKPTTTTTTATPSTPSFQLFDDPLKLSASQHLKLALDGITEIESTPKKVKLSSNLSDRSRNIFNNLSLDEMQAKLKEAQYFHSVASKRLKDIEEYIATREEEARKDDELWSKLDDKFKTNFYYFHMYKQYWEKCKELEVRNKQLENDYNSLKQQWDLVNSMFHTEMKKYEN